MPLDIVHVYTYAPYADEVATAEAESTLLKVVVPGPDVCDHAPMPIAGTLPPRLSLVRPHADWSAPTIAGLGFAQKFTVSFAVLEVQTPLEIVQVYTYVPYTDAVAIDKGSVLLLKVVVPVADICVHMPVPTVGVFPPNGLLPSPQIFCRAPVVAVVGT